MNNNYLRSARKHLGVIHLALQQRSCVHQICRRGSFWNPLWSEKNNPEEPVTKQHEKQDPAKLSLTPSQHLQQLASEHMPACGPDWRDTPLHNATIKAKILLSCESTFNKKIPDNQLGSILTINDLLSFLETKKTRQNPYTIFPSVDRARSKGKLPSNLSFPKVTAQSKSSLKPTRDPFQNFSSPEHAKFLTKQQKEARKKKRRHLTAWK